MALKTIYKLKGIGKLYADEKGVFCFENKPARKVYNNGSVDE